MFVPPISLADRKTPENAASSRRQHPIAFKPIHEANRPLLPRPVAGWDFSKVSIYPTGPAGSHARLGGAPAVFSLPPNLQAKLSIGRSDDPLEPEADKLAEQATRSRGSEAS